MTLTKKQREVLKLKFGGRCAYCGDELGDRWHADHMQAIRRESEFVAAPEGSHYNVVLRHTGRCDHPELDHIENMMPACQPCNLYKGGNTLEGWRQQLQELNRKLQDYSKHFRFAKAFGLVIEIDKPVVFYFEQFNKASPQAYFTKEVTQ